MTWGCCDLWYVVLSIWWTCIDANAYTTVTPWTNTNQAWRSWLYWSQLGKWHRHWWSNHQAITPLWLDLWRWIFATRCEQDPAPSGQANISAQSEQEGQGGTSRWGQCHLPWQQIKLMQHDVACNCLKSSSVMSLVGEVLAVALWEIEGL